MPRMVNNDCQKQITKSLLFKKGFLKKIKLLPD